MPLKLMKDYQWHVKVALKLSCTIHFTDSFISWYETSGMKQVVWNLDPNET